MAPQPLVDESLPARERILQAALRLFAERGYDGTTTKSIAEAAGVPSGLIFYHFDTKLGVLTAIMKERSLLPRGREVVEGDETMAPRETLEALGREFLIAATGDEHDLVRVLLHEVHLREAVAAEFEAVAGQLIEIVSEQFRRIPGTRDRADVAARMFVYTVVFAGVFRPPDDGQALVCGMLDLLVSGEPPA